VAQPIERAGRGLAPGQAQIDALQNGGDGGAAQMAGRCSSRANRWPDWFGKHIGDPAASNPMAEFGLPLLGVLGEWVLRGGALLALAWVLGGRPTAGSMFRMSGWTLVPDILRLLVALGVMVTVGRIPARGLSSFAPGGSFGGGSDRQ
jgi:hypothetical protein